MSKEYDYEVIKRKMMLENELALSELCPGVYIYRKQQELQAEIDEINKTIEAWVER